MLARLSLGAFVGFFLHCLIVPSLLAKVWMDDDAVVTGASLPTGLAFIAILRELATNAALRRSSQGQMGNNPMRTGG